EEIENIGGFVRNNRDQGNCLFYAIADQLQHLGVNAANIRRDVCEYLLSHQNLYIDFFDEEQSIQDYAAEMSNDGVYGDGRIFGPICDLFHIRLRIRMIGNVIMEHGRETDPIVDLGYIGRIHYVSVRFQ
ncbi:MAG: hypothetical protein EZS28_041860, partial [Streblomastix strix]